MPRSRSAGLRTGLALVACGALLLSGPFGGPVLAAQGAGPVITDVSYAGQGEVPRSGPDRRVWHSASHRFSVTVEAGDVPTEGELCVHYPERANDSRLGCTSVALQPGDVRTVSVPVSTLPSNGTTPVSLTIALRESDADGTVAEETVQLAVLRQDGDPDGDGLTNGEEVAEKTDLTSADTDGDGLADTLEAGNDGLSPVDADSDRDGLADGPEVREYQTDPAAADTDDDGLDDGDEVNNYGTLPNRRDTDADRLPDGDEIMTYQTNATAPDTDDDGLGDGAELQRIQSDPTEADSDGDGLADGEEQTIFATDPTETDTDGDGLDDHAEVRVHRTDPTAVDTDGDGIDDETEISRYGTNPNNPDTDSDGRDDGSEVSGASDPKEPRVGGPSTGPLGTFLAVVGRWPVLLGGSVVAFLTVVALGYWTDFVSSVSPESEHAMAESDGLRSDAERRDTVDDADLSLMTNEERVTHLLDANGGRMLQSDIVEAADWSKATVSRVLSEMEAEGAVVRIDIGKGNLVTLPDEEPEDVTSKLPDG